MGAKRRDYERGWRLLLALIEREGELIRWTWDEVAADERGSEAAMRDLTSALADTLLTVYRGSGAPDEKIAAVVREQIQLLATDWEGD